MMSIQRVTSITMLKTRVSVEDTLCDLSREFTVVKAKNVNKEVQPNTCGVDRKDVS